MLKRILHLPVFMVFLFSGTYGQNQIQFNDTSYFIPSDKDFNLLMSASKGHFDNVRSLILQGADINAVTIDNISPLMYATENGDFLMVEFLLKSGANPNLRPFNGVTALISASRLNYLEISELLINNGADINAADQEGVTALHYAAAYN
ncbi:MAG: ankyrin repeat domain-containing protein, partial [Bacteroidales bacterium]|nr:ankyrin repeat domain-containing protein [Bacteroidales bacterium]